MRELVIEYIPSTTPHPARVRVSYRANERAQAQNREGNFVWQYAPADRELIRWYLEEYLQCPWGAFKDRAIKAETTMTRIGTELFEAVFQNGEETRELYNNIRNDLANSRIVIHATDAAGIELPWELLRDRQRENCDLARLAHSFTRSQSDLDYDPPVLKDEGTFNILLVISRPAGEDDVPFHSVARRLLAAVRQHRDRIRVDVLRPPTFEQLAKVLEDHTGYYHALHFDGHGVFPGDQQQGVLVFESDSQPQRLVTGGELGQLLTEHRLPLVILNACQSGTTQAQATYPTIGNQLLKAGVGAVVAMAYSVYVCSAADFMTRFYERLADGQEVARAVHAGRADLFASKLRFSPLGPLPLADWIVPVLFEAGEVRLPVPSKGIQLRPPSELGSSASFHFFPPFPALGLIGRDGPMLRLERAFLRETLVLLRGMAGIGKTSTATGFARWLAETGGLEGQAFYFSFEHHLTLAGVCDRIGAAFQSLIKNQLGLEWAVQEASKRRDLALQILRETSCFLIWDNFEPVAGFPSGTASDWTSEEQAELREFLHALRDGKTKVLLCSRREERWLGGVVGDVELGGLNLGESQELAVKVLRRANIDDHALKGLDDYNDLLRFLRGNPLAIQAILPELKRQSPTVLLHALQSGEAKIHDDPTQGRERSLTASLNYRFDQLDEKTRQMLAVLGLFQGFVNTHVLVGISEQADAPLPIRGVDWNQWDNTLSRAADSGLLQGLGMGRYSLHPGLPWFFNNLLKMYWTQHLEWLEQCFCKAFCAVGRDLQEMAQSAPSPAYCQMEFEEANLKYALSLCDKQQIWDSMIGALDGLHVLLAHQGRWSEWERLVVSVETKITSINGEPIKPAVHLWFAILGYLSRIAEFRRQFDKKLKIDRQLGEYFRSIGDEPNYSRSLHHQGICAEATGDSDEAERLYLESAEIHRRLGDEYDEAVVLGQAASLAFKRGDLLRAEKLIKQVLPVFRKKGDSKYGAQSLHNLGNIYAERGEHVEALKQFNASGRIFASLGDENGIAMNLHHIGVMLLRQGQFTASEQKLRDSLTLAIKVECQDLQSRILFNLGYLAERQGESKEAVQFYEEALSCSRLINDTQLASKAEEAIKRLQVALQTQSIIS